MSDFITKHIILLIVFVQPALYLFLKSILVLWIVQRNVQKKTTRYKLSIILGVIASHLIPFFAVLGVRPLENVANFFSSLCYLIPSSGFNACSQRIIDYFLFPPARFTEGVTAVGFGILIFAPVILQSLFWILRFRKTGWELPLTLIGTSCLYAATFIGLYRIDMYAPLVMLIASFLIWTVYRIIKRLLK